MIKTIITDPITYPNIENLLNTNYIGRDYIHFNTIDSTNTYCKTIANDKPFEGTLVISENQTKGRGRQGRAWHSQNGAALMFSTILKPNIEPMKAGTLTLVAAAAIHLALKDLNIDTKIKWPNDIYLNNKKICGVLTELACEIAKIDYIILGIGLNVNLTKEDFPTELSNIASSLKIETGETLDRRVILSKILKHLEDLYEKFKQGDINEALEICTNASNVLGKEVTLIQGSASKRVFARRINLDGSLEVEVEGESFAVYSGEVSIREFY